MKELEEGMQKLKEAIEIKCPYGQIEAIGNLGVSLIELSNELGHNYDNCVNNSIDDLR